MTRPAFGATIVRMDDTGTPSPLSIRALDRARVAIQKGIRGGLPGWGRFRGPEVDGYLTAVGLQPPANRAHEGSPWCIAAQYANHKASEVSGEVSRCPRTASTLHAAAQAPEHCKLPGPRPGAVGILEHADGVHGHAVQCEIAHTDGSVVTVEGDTNGDGSSTGDAWGRHAWNPADGKRGRVLGWWDLGLQPPLTATAPTDSVESPPDAT